MSFVHGKAGFIQVDDSSGTPVDLSDFVTKVTWPRDFDTAEVSTFGVDSKQYVGGLMDSKVSMEGPWDAVVDAHFQGILGSATLKTVEHGPTGNTAGMRKLSAEGFITSYEVETGVDDAIKWKAEIQISGDVTAGTY